MVNPSGGHSEPRPDDTSVAILRPKKSYVFDFFRVAETNKSALYRPNRLIVDESSADDNSGKDLRGLSVAQISLISVNSRNAQPRHNGGAPAV